MHTYIHFHLKHTYYGPTVQLLFPAGDTDTNKRAMAPTPTGCPKGEVCLVCQRRLQGIMATESKVVTLGKRHLQEFPLETDQRSESGIVLSVLFNLQARKETVKGM